MANQHFGKMAANSQQHSRVKKWHDKDEDFEELLSDYACYLYNLQHNSYLSMLEIGLSNSEGNSLL